MRMEMLQTRDLPFYFWYTWVTLFFHLFYFVFHCIYHPVMVKGVGYFEGGASLGLIQYLKSIHYRLVIALFRLIQVCYFQLRNHLFNTYARSSEKLVFPTP